MRWSLVPVFLAMGMVNYLCRALFTLLVPRRGIGAFWERALAAMPLAVLTAMAIPAVLGDAAGPADALRDPRTLAAILTLAAARATRNLLVSAGTGTLCFLLLSHFR